MGLKKIYITGICVLLLISAHTGQGQTVAETLQNTAQLCLAGKYAQAYPKLRRACFFADSSLETACLEQLGICAFKTGNFDEAASCYQQLKNNDDGTNFNYYLQWQLKSLLNANKFEEVLKYSDTSLFDMDNDSILANLLFYRVLACVGLNRIPEVTQTVRFLADSLLKCNPKSTDSLLAAYARDCSLNPRGVYRKSLLLPGLGQLSIGDYRNASNAFILNAALISGFIVTASYHPLIDAALFWTLPVLHYYVGNAKAAGDLAVIRQQQYVSKYYQLFIAYLSAPRK